MTFEERPLLSGHVLCIGSPRLDHRGVIDNIELHQPTISLNLLWSKIQEPLPRNASKILIQISPCNLELWTPNSHKVGISRLDPLSKNYIYLFQNNGMRFKCLLCRWII